MKDGDGFDILTVLAVAIILMALGSFVVVGRHAWRVRMKRYSGAPLTLPAVMLLAGTCQSAVSPATIAGIAVHLLVAGFPAARIRPQELEIVAFGSGRLSRIYRPIFLGAEMAKRAALAGDSDGTEP